ncbi:eukaryotic translation initiation factor 3 subunit [Apiospora rasikravindrae]|uniref:Eukaryotic translation initiation factor 3 subunit K n=1 Tax=Apiospora rasikravindrae TaxID=990691 RepID=A0ABR1RY34_9PEZI
MECEDTQERPEAITAIINGLERYNPEAVGLLEDYLRQQCEQRYCDCNANRTLLKLYQLNPDRMKDEVVTNVLLPEALAKLRELNTQLQGAQYSRFWRNIEGDDLCADLVADIDGFEDMVRIRIATLVSHAFREVDVAVLAEWLGLEEGAARKFVQETVGWKIEGDKVQVPRNAENEAKKAEVREDVNVDMFSRVVRRAWEETA